MGTIDTILSAFAGILVLPRWPRFQPSSAKHSGGILKRLRVARRNRMTRLHLVDLTDDQLRDIGITRAEALGEIRKSAFL